jgi:hypothetical protein
MAPGMERCGSGDGPNDFDMVSVLEKWVEGGKTRVSIGRVRYVLTPGCGLQVQRQCG